MFLCLNTSPKNDAKNVVKYISERNMWKQTNLYSYFILTLRRTEKKIRQCERENNVQQTSRTIPTIYMTLTFP